MNRFGGALQERDFRLWWLALLGMGCSLQMVEVTVGWVVYAQHHSALDLGWISLVEFIPMFVLALPAGQLADRAPRRLIFASSLGLAVAICVGLAVVVRSRDASVLPYLALAAGAGTATAVAMPAARAMPPTLVGPGLLHSAMTLRSIAAQSAQVLGPALGGFLYVVSPTLVYLLAAGTCALSAVAVMRMRQRGVAETDGSVSSAATATSLLEGLRFVGRTQILLGAILLDLFAVLFGGAITLLPVFARSIEHVGATGLGVMRAAPAVGALLAAALLTRRPIQRHAGRLLLTVVLLYGASMIVFGLSTLYPLSLLALAFSGFVDLYSVNIRSTTVALASPNRLRGRVNAVEMVFISASNQLGGFESGFLASLVGPIPAVVGGGAITMLLALVWRRLFPALAEVDRLEQVQPATASA